MLDRYDKADIVAVIGMALAAVDMASMAPTNVDLIGEGGLGLAGLAIISNIYHKHKANILSKIASKLGRDEAEVEKVIDGVEDAVEDLLDDGKLNDSN
tara:strand:- start:76 stop:369 length:294 start_codon:yes stop_codon:yes gene_type:complete